MKRLVDGGEPGAAGMPGSALSAVEQSELRELFQGIPPTGELAAAEERVRARLAGRPPAGPLGGGGLVGVIVGAGVVAGLLFVGMAWHGGARGPGSNRTSVAGSISGGETRTTPPAPQPLIEAPPTPPHVSPGAATTVEDRVDRKGAGGRHAIVNRGGKGDPAAAVARCELEPLDTAVVVDAVGALRRDDDPNRALLLLDYYLRQKPGGALVEEAMALAIEAAVRRGEGGARTRATSYLERYPTGRYAAYARSIERSPAGAANAERNSSR